jgi:hypothetical protein
VEEEMNVRTHLGLILLVLLAGAGARADSISPEELSTSLEAAETLSFTKTVTVEPRTGTEKVDVFFLFDTTRTFSSETGLLKRGDWSSIVSGLLGAAGGLSTDVAVGLGHYQDFPQVDPTYTFGAPTDVPYELLAPMESISAGYVGTSVYSEFLDMSTISGDGGDTAESQLHALHELAKTGNTTGWRDDATRILIWVGDSPGNVPGRKDIHGNAYPGTVTTLDAIDVLAGAGIVTEALDFSSRERLNALVQSDWWMDQLDPTTRDLDEDQADRITDATHGRYWNDVTAETFVDTATLALLDAFNAYWSVDLDLSEVPGAIDFLASAGYTGDWDRRDGARSFDFDVTVGGQSYGEWLFSVYGSVNGIRTSTESDHIKVGPGDVVETPEPSAIVLVGLGLAGLGLTVRRRRRR